MDKPKDKTPRPPENPWEKHELEQLLRLSKLTMPEKLQWLEDAHRRVRNLKQNPGQNKGA